MVNVKVLDQRSDVVSTLRHSTVSESSFSFIPTFEPQVSFPSILYCFTFVINRDDFPPFNIVLQSGLQFLWMGLSLGRHLILRLTDPVSKFSAPESPSFQLRDETGVLDQVVAIPAPQCGKVTVNEAGHGMSPVWCGIASKTQLSFLTTTHQSVCYHPIRSKLRRAGTSRISLASSGAPNGGGTIRRVILRVFGGFLFQRPASPQRFLKALQFPGLNSLANSNISPVRIESVVII